MKLIKSLIMTLSLLSPLCVADIAVIVHPANADALTQKDIKRLFLGKTQKFPSGTAAKPINLNADVSLRAEFDEKALGRSSSQVTAYWSKLVFTGKGVPPEELSNADDIAKKVASNPSAIGYLDASSVPDSVKVIATF